MPRPLLPPKSIPIPTELVFNPEISPVLLQTWIRLRCLAWGRKATPCLPFLELASIVGRSPSTLFRHMAQLRHLSVLSWRSTGLGTLSVCFGKQPYPAAPPGPPSSTLNFQGCDPSGASAEIGSAASTLDDHEPPIRLDGTGPPAPDSQNRESPSQSLNPPHYIHDLQIPESDSQILELNNQPVDNLESEGEFEGEGLPSRLAAGDKPSFPAPVACYRALVHLTPNPSQRRLLESRVTDLPLWQGTLEHWVSHGWNPMNLAGMLDLYSRGGPSACRYCQATPGSSPGVEASHTTTQQALATLRRELGISSAPDPP